MTEPSIAKRLEWLEASNKRLWEMLSDAKKHRLALATNMEGIEDAVMKLYEDRDAEPTIISDEEYEALKEKP